MNLFSKLSTWYFSRKALPYWSIILLDCLVILFSGLLVYALNNGIFATMGIFWHLSLTWGVCLVPYLVGFQAVPYVFGHHSLLFLRGFATGGLRRAVRCGLRGDLPRVYGFFALLGVYP